MQLIRCQALTFEPLRIEIYTKTKAPTISAKMWIGAFINSKTEPIIQDTEKTTKVNENINPEIKEKATELFDLIDNKWQNEGKTTDTAENLAEYMGDLLSEHRGFQELKFAYRIAATQTQAAEHNLESSTWYMTDEALSKLYDITLYVTKILKLWNGVDKLTSDDIHTLSLLIRHMRDTDATDLHNLIGYEWESRAKAYRRELQESKG